MGLIEELGEQKLAASRWKFGEACPYCGGNGMKLTCWRRTVKERVDKKIRKHKFETWRITCRSCKTYLRDVQEEAVLKRYGKQIHEYCKSGHGVPI